MDSTTARSITIRPAYPDDVQALRRLAHLDSAAVPAEPLLLAEVDGELQVAVSMSDLSAIADPFAPTAHVVDLVRDHIRHTAETPGPRRRLRRKLTPALAPRLV
jgi:hypothetical protein